RRSSAGCGGSRAGWSVHSPPMPRRVFTLLSAASLVLCAATCVLWVRSYWVVDSYGWDRPGGHRQLSSCRGSVILFTLPGATPGRFSVGHSAWPASEGAQVGERVAPGVTTYDEGTMRFVGVAYWLACAPPAAMVTPLFAGGWLRRRRRRRRKAGLCPACGYDLRASPGRCPECGAGPKGAAE
ncbi:MAG: hypothetical protein JWO31_2490, partial [Phycisphaerales bacterium]|nr:hypothetical protein [Phycisphaerales bacterium]